MTLFVVENLDANHQRKLFRFMGTDYVTTSSGGLNLPLMIGLGIVLAFVFAPDDASQSTVVIGIIYGLLTILTSQLHSLGHVISSKLVNAPVSAIIMTMTVNVAQYDDSRPHPSRVHVGRAMGGPLLNLAVGLIALAVYSSSESHYALYFGVINIAFFLITMSPIPSVDGAAILRELRHWEK